MTEESNVADYLLFRLNNSFKKISLYPKILNISSPTDDIHSLLTTLALRHNYTLGSELSIEKTLHTNSHLNHGGLLMADDEWTTSRPVEATNDNGEKLDLERAARWFIRKFRDGEFGSMTLDDCSEEALKTYFERGPEALYGSSVGAPGGKARK
ncbi:hypothetical protein HK097_001126 [Rhizophlyctis rosea]|uniref:Uncharacterized protein n=1 Tax=Rhizophlyctis rosea TaxID=64517 RepID=A0AAD5S790_9FUNG|nr:hypothetical protein HK097_001126 [Rhizophlyctis rosea]